MLSLFTTLADTGIDINQLIRFVVLMVVVGLICWLLWWFIGYAGIPEPFNKVARVIIALVAILFLITLLLRLVGIDIRI